MRPLLNLTAIVVLAAAAPLTAGPTSTTAPATAPAVPDLRGTFRGRSGQFSVACEVTIAQEEAGRVVVSTWMIGKGPSQPDVATYVVDGVPRRREGAAEGSTATVQASYAGDALVVRFAGGPRAKGTVLEVRYTVRADTLTVDTSVLHPDNSRTDDPLRPTMALSRKT